MKIKRFGKKTIALVTATVVALGALTGCGKGSGSSDVSDANTKDGSDKKVEITNVSYDPTRELYAAYTL